jgi:hypothetical protein
VLDALLDALSHGHAAAPEAGRGERAAPYSALLDDQRAALYGEVEVGGARLE